MSRMCLTPNSGRLLFFPVKKNPQMRKCEVTFAYNPVNHDELQLSVGEIIEIVREVESRRQHSDPRCTVWVGGPWSCTDELLCIVYSTD